MVAVMEAVDTGPACAMLVAWISAPFMSGTAVAGKPATSSLIADSAVGVPVAAVDAPSPGVPEQAARSTTAALAEAAIRPLRVKVARSPGREVEFVIAEF